MNNLNDHISRRTNCPLCLSSDLSQPIEPHNNLSFPLLPVCVDTPLSEDHFAPFTIVMCGNCGLITLLDVVDPEILYEIFHSDGIGGIWEEHYKRFAAIICKYHKEGRVVEIGAGQGKLVKKLLPHYTSGVEVVDPQYEGERNGVVVHNNLCDKAFAESLRGQFQSMVSSHTLEHFIEFDDYFSSAWICLKEGGMLFTSVPNQEAGFAKGYGNMLNFEHPSICSNLHWIYLHYKNGFVVKDISLFRGHSIMIVAEKVPTPISFDLDFKEFSKQLIEQYTENINDRIRKVRDFATDDKENWLFGASNFSQPLFVYGLEESYFKGILDNSPLKHDKRLYGTSLMCRKPEDTVGKGNQIRAFLNLGSYNDEVREQLRLLDPENVECITL